MSHVSTQKISFAGFLITLGIVFGDIGTSPLYVFQAITDGGKHISEPFILGALSSVIWTLILLATIKYIHFALNADNNGEGGIFALFALLKKRKLKWIIIPALIGCATLMADGFITPAISISSAVEGVNNIFPEMPINPIVVTIIVILFVIQQFGTAAIGKMFGPVMIIWFAFLGYLGSSATTVCLGCYILCSACGGAGPGRVALHPDPHPHPRRLLQGVPHQPLAGRHGVCGHCGQLPGAAITHKLIAAGA